MLMGNDKQRLRRPRFEHLFLRFGAGAHLFDPLTKSRFWNPFCWTTITLGVIGWVVAFWILRPFAE